MNELSITNKYPAEQYNLLGNTDVIVEVPDIKSPVIQSIRLNPDPKKGDVYIQIGRASGRERVCPYV